MGEHFMKTLLARGRSEWIVNHISVQFSYMETPTHNTYARRAHIPARMSPAEWLGVWIGIVMPIISAAAYPTYMHSMQTPWVEWSRLLEAPFVVCEIGVIFWAGRKGMNSSRMWRSLPKDIKIASVFLAFGVFASSLFISEQPLKSVTISLITAVHMLFAFSIYHLLRHSNGKDFRPFVMLLGAGLISLSALTFWRFALPPPPSTVPGGVIEWSSALPGFISVRHFGSWTGAIAAGFLIMVLYDAPKVRNSWPQILYFLSAAMTVWSGTRAAILAILVTLLIILVATRKWPSGRAMGVAAMLSGAALTAAWLLLPYNDPIFLLFDPNDTANASVMTGGRLDLWTATFLKWQTAPLLGLGSGSTFWEVYLGWPHTQPHNAILQFLISWGVIGTAAALWLLGRALMRVHIAATRNTSLLPLVAILYTLLTMSLLEGMLHYPRFIMLIFVMLAAVIARGDTEQSNTAGDLGTLNPLSGTDNTDGVC